MEAAKILPVSRDFFVIVQQQPGGVLLIDDSEVIVRAQLGIHQEDRGRAFQADLRAV